MSSRFSRVLLTLTVSLFSIGGGRVEAQTPADPAPDPGGTTIRQEPATASSSESEILTLLRQIGSDYQHFPSVDSALWVGGGGVLSLFAHPHEKNLNARFMGPAWVDGVYDGGDFAGDGYTQVSAAFATYFAGKWSRKPKLQHIGSDLIRSHALAGIPTVVLKQTINRQRPDKGNHSFPSGHASVTFASATVLSRHLGWRAGIPAYLVATWVAASRLHENQHYVTDVLFGAGLGIAAGRTVTRHGRSVWVLIPSAPSGGIGIALTRIPRGSAATVGGRP